MGDLISRHFKAYEFVQCDCIIKKRLLEKSKNEASPLTITSLGESSLTHLNLPSRKNSYKLPLDCVGNMSFCVFVCW